MTLAQFITRVRRRHNDEDSSSQFWSEPEIYELITSRCNEVLSIVGLLEATDTSNTSVSGTQVLAYPSDTVTIRQVDYKFDRLKRLTFREAESFKSDSGFDSGRPRNWFPWKREINFIPVPDTTGDAITIYYYKDHDEIDNSAQATIDIPQVLHPRLLDGVLSDMFSKDENERLTAFYENKWISVHIPAFQNFKAEEDSASRFQVLSDVDSQELGDIGTG